VSEKPSAPIVRHGRSDEFEDLRALEFRADKIFETIGVGPFSNDDTEDHLSQAILVLVAGDPPAGFVCLETVGGFAHIWQLAVDPVHARRGIGRLLVVAACEWARSEGFDAITLTTYRDVPWNGPFYASAGFVILDELSPALGAIRQHEREIGDDDFGPRIAMRRDLR
jgi:GNAT superfamily N-acetyltransferase